MRRPWPPRRWGGVRLGRAQVGFLGGLVVEEPVLFMPAELDEELASEGTDPLAALWGRDRFAPVDPISVTQWVLRSITPKPNA